LIFRKHKETFTSRKQKAHRSQSVVSTNMNTNTNTRTNTNTNTNTNMLSYSPNKTTSARHSIDLNAFSNVPSPSSSPTKLENRILKLVILLTDHCVYLPISISSTNTISQLKETIIKSIRNRAEYPSLVFVDFSDYILQRRDLHSMFVENLEFNYSLGHYQIQNAVCCLFVCLLVLFVLIVCYFFFHHFCRIVLNSKKDVTKQC
jgi:hypothetical protein